jgi:diacylglycerol kinase (ATP)
MKTGYSITKKIKYSLAGFISILEEPSNKIILLIYIFSLILYILKVVDTNVLLLAVLAVVSEAVNTAVERLADLITQEYNENIKKTKDILSFATFFVVLNWFLLLVFEIF